MSETPMTPERLAEIAARAAAATPGPWGFYDGDNYADVAADLDQTSRGSYSYREKVARLEDENYWDDPAHEDHDEERAPEQMAANAAFIAHAREDVPALLARVAELEAERHTTNEALSEAAEALRRQRDRITDLEAAQAEAVSVSETLYQRLVDEKLAGSALYAALTMPTTPEQRQAALDRFHAVAQKTGQLHAPTEQADAAGCGCPRNVIDGDVGGHFFKKGALSDSPVACIYCGAVKPEGGDAR
ncbi:hypothetical protein [Streptomyces werraensis]|uniref:hypothetical protein n=1 Tax=Streptomyces werraensis TaxID=68284 RepID=UPI0036B3057D